MNITCEEKLGKITLRLNKAQGQVVALKKMITEHHDCGLVVNQFKAAYSALKKAQETYVKFVMDDCVADKSITPEQKKENIASLVSYL